MTSSTDNTLVSLQEEYENRQIQEVLDELENDLVGLAPVKDRIKEIAALLLIHRLRKLLGLSSANPNLHMSFTGSPGTGKTTVALKMADILFRLGYIRKGHLITVTRDDLVIIFAGYKERMDSFYESNPGLSSRVANHVDFPDYSPEELLIIAKIMVEEQQYLLTPESEKVLLDYIKLRMTEPHFANARSVRNAIDRARMRQANRIFASGDRMLTKTDLVTIQANDILRSRLFKG